MVAFNIDEQAFRSVMRERQRAVLIAMIRGLLPDPPPRIRHKPTPKVKDYLIPKAGYQIHAIINNPGLNMVHPDFSVPEMTFRECGVYVCEGEPTVCPCGEYRWAVEGSMCGAK